MGHLKPFSNIFGAASRAVLQEFSSMEAIASPPFPLIRRRPRITHEGRLIDRVTNCFATNVASNSMPSPLKAEIRGETANAGENFSFA